MTKKEKEQLYAAINGLGEDQDKNFKKMSKENLVIGQGIIKTLAEKAKEIVDKIKELSSDVDKNFKKMSKENRAIAEGAVKVINLHTDEAAKRVIRDVNRHTDKATKRINKWLEVTYVVISAILAIVAGAASHIWMLGLAQKGYERLRTTIPGTWVPGMTDSNGNVINYVLDTKPDTVKIWVITVFIAIIAFMLLISIKAIASSIIKKSEGGDKDER